MNISLRKASALQASIQEVLKSIKLENTLELNEFQDAEREIATASAKLIADDLRRQQLLVAYYTIRELVGVANSQSGIDIKLTKAAYIDKRIAQLQEIADMKPQRPLTEVVGQLNKIRARPADARPNIYSQRDTVDTWAVAQDHITAAKTEIQQLKKQKQKINDETLELNIKTEVSLADNIVSILTKEGLV